MQELEIMAPAGSYESLAAALRAGADSVYFGVGVFNMRARSTVNFQPEDLPKVARLCHACGAKAYLTCNVIIYDEELEAMQQLLLAAKAAGVDAVIAADLSVISYAHSIGLEVHISVQANVCNVGAVRFFAAYADVMVLARELKLSQIRHIIDTIRRENITGPSGKPVRIEIFAHGALCIGISGKCGMSLAAYNRSANRGQCFQLCRRKYRVTDTETGFEMDIDNQYIMSPKDICTIRVVDQLVEAGVSVFKLEGRGRSEAYVSTVTQVYKEAVSDCAAGTWSPEKVAAWEERLLHVFNRHFWHGGYYLGEEWDTWSGCSNSLALEQRRHLGRVMRWYAKAGVAEIRLEAEPLSPGDKIEITGCTTGIVRVLVSEVRCDDEQGVTQIVPTAPKGATALIAVPQKVRHGDKVYLVTRRKLS
ncbi:MAG: U32 family peptidase [Akkermansia sp.]|nr:U32 family peptidase [Akkermansia sp.]